jgi:WD40 repeat protein
VTGGYDRNVIYWDLVAGGQITSFEGGKKPEEGGSPVYNGHSDWVNVVALLPTGSQAVSAGADGFIKVWDLEARQLLREGQVNQSGVRALCLRADGWLFSAAPGPGLEARQIEDLQPQAALALDEMPVGMALSPNGEILVGDRGGNVYCLRFTSPG